MIGNILVTIMLMLACNMTIIVILGVLQVSSKAEAEPKWEQCWVTKVPKNNQKVEVCQRRVVSGVGRK